MIMDSKKEILLPLLIILLMFTSTHPVSNLEPVFEPLELGGILRGLFGAGAGGGFDSHQVHRRFRE